MIQRHMILEKYWNDTCGYKIKTIDIDNASLKVKSAEKLKVVFGDSRCCFLLQILSEPRILCRSERKLVFQVQFKTHDLKFELNDKFCKDNWVHVVREEVEEPPVPLRKRKDQQDHWRKF